MLKHFHNCNLFVTFFSVIKKKSFRFGFTGIDTSIFEIRCKITLKLRYVQMFFSNCKLK